MIKRTYNRVPVDLRDRALDMYDDKRPVSRIARDLELHPSTVYGILMAAGEHKPAQREAATLLLRNGRPVITFDRDEDDYIRAQAADGVRVGEIARRVAARFGRHRSGSTIGRRLVALAGLELA